MKELIGSARNLLFTPTEDGTGIQPVVEVVLAISEPTYALHDLQLVKTQGTDVIRFTATPGRLLGLAQDLIVTAQAAQDVADHWNGKGADDAPAEGSDANG